MGYAKVFSAQTTGLTPHVIDVEVDVSRGLHSFTVVGLPDKAVEESRDRVSAAIKNTGISSPKSQNHKVVVSLAPAGVRKEGPLFDLAIAVAYLSATNEVSVNPRGKLFLGELSLDGKLRPIRGVLPLMIHAREKGFTEVFIPQANAEEAALIDGIAIFPATTLEEVLDHLKIEKEFTLNQQPQTKISSESRTADIDFSDVRGQESAKRALEIAAAGGHNVCMYGPPGTGKTMLARAFCGILPGLTFEEVLEVTGIHSVAGTSSSPLVTRPPFRSPHHTSSYVSMVGGGTYPKPGEVTLAHRGVLFLDEFAEFEKRVLETLRQPIEDRVVTISRSKGTAVFPADFILVAAMNPYPKSHYQGDSGYSALQLERYRQKISGPIMDRIDIWIEVPHIEYEKLSSKENKGEGSDSVRNRVEQARQRQRVRHKGETILNSSMSARDIENLVTLSDETKQLLNESAKKLDLSARSYHKIIKLARTIADLDEKDTIETSHILEALQYRPREIT